MIVFALIPPQNFIDDRMSRGLPGYIAISLYKCHINELHRDCCIACAVPWRKTRVKKLNQKALRRLLPWDSAMQESPTKGRLDETS